MITEFQNEKSQFKKVYSETSFLKFTFKKNVENSEESATEKHVSKSPFLNELSKQRSKSLNNINIKGTSEVVSGKGEVSVFCKKSKHHQVIYQVPFNSNLSTTIAGRRILNLLMLHAWRRQKQEFKLYQEKTKTLHDKLEGFEMQVYVLRQLLSAEKNRMETAQSNIHELLQKLEKTNNDKDLLVKKNEELEKNFNNLLEYCSQTENAFKNQENDIITARLEAENWEKQLTKEREKLKKMESEEVFLKEKIRLNEKVILVKSQLVEQLTEANKELQQKLDGQVPLWDATMAQVDLANIKLKESEVVKDELQKALGLKGKEIEELKQNISALEKKLKEEDEKNGILGKSLQEKSNELVMIQNKMYELSSGHYPWSGGIVKMASLCAKIPVACICTMGSLLLPFPSYRL